MDALGGFTKKSLRTSIKGTLRSLAGTEKLAEDSAAACARVLALDAVKNASTISLFLSMPSEIDTRPLLEQLLDRVEASSLHLFVPFVVNKGSMDMFEVRSTSDYHTFAKNSWGIPEPSNPEDRQTASSFGKLDVIIAPGVAFDRKGGRLGHGMGYYDRYITKVEREMGRPLVIGFCLDEQVIDEVPMSVTDRRVDALVTPTTTSFVAKSGPSE